MGPDGTPHSWRVEMLPYLERQHGYDIYRMDDSWDSENNLAVAKAAADLFTARSDAGSDGCDYFLLTGPSTPFDLMSVGAHLRVRTSTIEHSKSTVPLDRLGGKGCFST
jgi:hypothetical protein